MIALHIIVHFKNDEGKEEMLESGISKIMFVRQTGKSAMCLALPKPKASNIISINGTPELMYVPLIDIIGFSFQVVEVNK